MVSCQGISVWLRNWAANKECFVSIVSIDHCEDLMTTMHDSIKSFLEQFQANINSKDATAQASHFSKVFLAAGPGGAAPVKVESLCARREWYF